MPSDDLFPDGTPEGTTPEATPPGNGKDPTGEAPITMAAAAELITNAQAPLLEKINELTAATASAVNSMQVINASANQINETDSDPPEDFLTRFANDPEGTVRQISAESLQTAAPLVASLINSTVSNFIGREQTDIDREFGDGAWTKFFDKPMGTIVDGYRKSNATALANDTTISREVDGLKGRQFNDLVQFREASRKGETEADNADDQKFVDSVTENVMNQTNLSGGIRRISGAEEEVTEGVKGYLAERIAAIGGNETGKDFLERTDYGNTLEDFQAHQKKITETATAASGGK